MNENKTNINWYPGHMAKTERLITNELKNIDIIYELVDARIPYSSKNKNISKLIANKKRILIMTKKDLCDMEVTLKWVEYYKNSGNYVLVVDLKDDKDYKKVIDLTHMITGDIQCKRKEKGLKEKEIRALVIGIPNVGKSTLINRLAGKNVAKAENKPGVTQNLTYLKTNVGITILDTPGILWPKFNDQKEALNIATVGGIKKEVLNIDEISYHILETLCNRYPNILKEKYNIVSTDINEIYELIGKRIGAYKNSELDYDKINNKIYNDVISGVIKGVTYDEFN